MRREDSIYNIQIHTDYTRYFKRPEQPELPGRNYILLGTAKYSNNINNEIIDSDIIRRTISYHQTRLGASVVRPCLRLNIRELGKSRAIERGLNANRQQRRGLIDACKEDTCRGNARSEEGPLTAENPDGGVDGEVEEAQASPLCILRFGHHLLHCRRRKPLLRVRSRRASGDWEHEPSMSHQPCTLQELVGGAEQEQSERSKLEQESQTERLAKQLQRITDDEGAE